MRTMLVLVALVIAAPAWAGSLHTEEISYSANGTTLKGYIAYDASIEGSRPGVLVVHEWWGHNDYARRRARMLAELGYTGFALDMYGEGRTADHPKQAGEMSSKIRQDLPLAKRRFKAAMEVLREHDTTRPDDIAAIGYCFGGGIVLEMARAGLNLDGVASFHGSLPTQNPAQPGEVKAEVLVLHGAEDPFTKPGQVEAFKQEMERADVDYEFVVYEGAKHSFTNPQADEFGKRFDLPLEYNAEADRQSWEKMRTFLDDVFAD